MTVASCWLQRGDGRHAPGWPRAAVDPAIAMTLRPLHPQRQKLRGAERGAADVQRLRRAPLEGGQALGNMVEGLLVDGEDGEARRTVELGIVQRADLYHDDRARRAGREMGAALGAELTRDRSRQILARELPRRAFGVAKGVRGHDHEEVGRAP